MGDSDLTFEVSDELYEALRRRGEANGRSAEDEARDILIAAFPADPDPPS